MDSTTRQALLDPDPPPLVTYRAIPSRQIDNLRGKIEKIIAREANSAKNSGRPLREIFLAKVWPELKADYTQMLADIMKLLESGLLEANIKTKVRGGVKERTSIENTLRRREDRLLETEQRGFRDLWEVFAAMHDLVWTRIVYDLKQTGVEAASFVKAHFQEKKPPGLFKIGDDVGTHWQRPVGGAYETDNYRVAVSDESSAYHDVVFEIQLTSVHNSEYSEVSHGILYKKGNGDSSRQLEQMVDLFKNGCNIKQMARELISTMGGVDQDSTEGAPSRAGMFRLATELSSENVRDVRWMANKMIPQYGDMRKSPEERPQAPNIISNFYHNSQIQKDLLEEKRRVLRKALYRARYEEGKRRNPRRVAGTCQWFVQHPRFKEWLRSEPAVPLLVDADPGCGKSVLARYLVDDVLRSSDSRTTCYFFFKDESDDQGSASVAICCILHQIFTQKPNLLTADIQERVELALGADLEEPKVVGKNLKAPGALGNLFGILVDVSKLPNAGEIVCVIDALDECAETGRKRLIMVLQDLYRDDSSDGSTLRILLTSRPYPHIMRDLFWLTPHKKDRICLSGDNKEDAPQITAEINRVVEAKVETLSERLQLDPDEKMALLTELTKFPNRTYLWLHLVCAVIEEEFMDDRAIDDFIQDTIKQLPRTVEEAYEKLLMTSPEPAKTKIMLEMVIASPWQMELSLMANLWPCAITRRHATLSEPEPDAPKESKPLSEERMRETISRLCGLLLTVVDGQICLLHETVRDFLLDVNKEDRPCLEREGSASAHIPRWPPPWKASLRLHDCRLTLKNSCHEYMATVPASGDSCGGLMCLRRPRELNKTLVFHLADQVEYDERREKMDEALEKSMKHLASERITKH